MLERSRFSVVWRCFSIYLLKITSIKFVVEKKGEVAFIFESQEVHRQASFRRKNSKKKEDHGGYNRYKYPSPRSRVNTANSRFQTVCRVKTVYTSCRRKSEADWHLYGGTILNRKYRSGLCSVHECSPL